MSTLVVRSDPVCKYHVSRSSIKDTGANISGKQKPKWASAFIVLL